MRTDYQMCTRCIMDTSDPEITFDKQGVCSNCHSFDTLLGTAWFPNAEGQRRLQDTLKAIRETRHGQKYDCILGLSGGVDSSYLALRAKEWDLRPLVVHVDAGWNSEQANANVNAIVNYCNWDLHTTTINWNEMKDLQLAYLKSGISNQDVPQDHAFFASLYHFATSNGIRYILSGGNIATEGVFPAAWHGSAMDAINLKAIHQRYGNLPLFNYPTISFFQYYVWYPFIKKMRTIRPLNYMKYIKKEAILELEETVGYKRYDKKHGESRFTRLFQNYYLPTRFGMDKRRPHLSSLILSNQITREDALNELSFPLYDPDDLQEDLNYVCNKLEITSETFDKFLQLPIRSHTDFRNWNHRRDIIKFIQNMMERVRGKRVKIYS